MLRAPLAGPSMLLTAPLQTTAGNMPGPEVHIHECHDTWQGLRLGPDTALVRNAPAVQRVAHSKDAHSLLFLHPLGQTSDSTMNSASEENEPTVAVDYGAVYGLPFGLQIQPNSTPLDASNVAATASEADESAAFPAKRPSQPLSGDAVIAKHGQQRRPSNTGGVDQPPLVTLQRYMPYSSTDPKSGFAATVAPKLCLQRLEPLVPLQLPPHDQLPQRFLAPQPQRQRQQLVLLQRISPHGANDEEGGSEQRDTYVRAAVLPPAYMHYYGEATDGLGAGARPLYLQPVGFERGPFDQGPRPAGRDLTGRPDPEEQLRQRSYALQMQHGPATTAPYPTKDEDLQGEATTKTMVQPQMQPGGAQMAAPAAIVKVESSSEAAAVVAAAGGPSALKVETSDRQVAPTGAATRSRQVAGGATDSRGGSQCGLRTASNGGTEAEQADMDAEAAVANGCQFWDLAALAEVACRASELDREERCGGDRKSLFGKLGGKDEDGDACMSEDDLSESYSARGMDMDRVRDRRAELEGGRGGVGGRAWRACKPPPGDSGSNGVCGYGGCKNEGGSSVLLPVTVPHTDRKNPKVLAPRSGRVGDTKHLVLPAEIVQALPEAMLDGQEPVQVLALMPAMAPEGPEGSSPHQPHPSWQQYQKADITCHVGNGPGGFPALHLSVVEAVYGRPVRRFTLRADLVLELELGVPVVRVPRGGGGGKRTATQCESGDSESAATGPSNGEVSPPDAKAAVGATAGAVTRVHSLPTTLVREGVWEQAVEKEPSPRPASMPTTQHQPPACPRISDDADGSCVTGINMIQQGINSCGPANEAGRSAGAAAGAGIGALATAATGEATPVATAGAALAPASVSRRGRGGGGATGPGLPITVRRPLTGKPTVMRSCTGAVGSKKHLPLPQEIIKALPVEQVSGVEPVQVAVVIVPPAAAGSAAAVGEHITAQQEPLERLLCTIGPTGSHGCTALQVPVSRGMNGRRLVYIKLRTDLELELGLGDVVAMIPPRPRSVTAGTNGSSAMATAASGAASDTATAGAAVAMPGHAVDPSGGHPPYKRHCSSNNAVGNAVGGAGGAANAAAAAAAAVVASASTPSPATISNFAAAVAAAAAAAGGGSWSAASGIRVLAGIPLDGDAGLRHQQHQQLNQPLLASGQHKARLPPPPPVVQQSQQQQQRAPVRPERVRLEGDAAEPPETPFICSTAVPLTASGAEALDTRGSPSRKRDATAAATAAAATAAAAGGSTAAAAVPGATSSRQSTVEGVKAAANASAGAAEAVAQAASTLGRVWALLRQVPRVQLVATRVLAAVRQRPAEGGGDGAALLAGFRGCLGGILNLLNNAREAAAADAAAGQQAVGAGLFRGGDVRVCRCLLAAAPTMLCAAECLLEWYSLLAEVQDEVTAVSYATELGSSAALVKAQLAEELAPLLALQGLMS